MAVVVLDRELAAVVLVDDLPDPCVDREGFDAVQPEQEHAVGDLIADAVDAFQVGAGLLGLHAGQLMQVDPAVGDVLSELLDVLVAVAEAEAAQILAGQPFPCREGVELVAGELPALSELLAEGRDQLLDPRDVVVLADDEADQRLP